MPCAYAARHVALAHELIAADVTREADRSHSIGLPEKKHVLCHFGGFKMRHLEAAISGDGADVMIFGRNVRAFGHACPGESNRRMAHFVMGLIADTGRWSYECMPAVELNSVVELRAF